jgi:PrtD family type I secretion system ABC transporter
MGAPMTDNRASVIKQSLHRSRKIFWSVGAFSLFINLALLNGPLFMLQVYDRVLTSQSRETLIVLTILSVGILIFQGMVEVVRSRILIRAGAKLDADLRSATFGLSFEGKPGEQQVSTAQGLRDLDTVRNFLAGPGLIALFDAPWAPIFLGIVFIVHPFLGALALIGACVILALAYASEIATRQALQEASNAHRDSEYYVGTLQTNAESARSMGMARNLERRWQEHHEASLAWQAVASERAARLSSAAKFARQGLQTFALALGAWLTLEGQISAGAIVASSIIMGRGLQPLEAAVSQWRALIHARQAYKRLSAALANEPNKAERTKLPAPTGAYRLENVVLRLPGLKEPIINGVSFELRAGETLGLIGPTGSGKTTLARLMLGSIAPTAGSVRLDGVEVSDWPAADIGPHIGYLSQDVELLDGTVAENISRYGEHDSDAIVSAAKVANAHEFILALPNGYDTMIGERGRLLSGGQRQRIGLARAVFGSSKIVILDEPNANLDATGEAGLRAAVEAMKAQGRTVIVITHRPGVLPAVDKIGVVQGGQIVSFGPRDQVLAQLNKAAGTPTRVPANAQTSEPRHATS